ncbi:hypothetical protein Tco_0525187 [Tanacetum coccineum]
MDIFAFIHTPDSTKVKVVKRERKEDEPLLLQTTVGRTVPLLPVAPDRAESELEVSVDRLFDEGGSGDQTEQGGSVGSRRGVDIQLVSEATNIVAEDMAHLGPRRQRKRKTVVVDAGESSHPPKRLREDHGTPSGAFVGGKSMYAVQRLLIGAVLNAEVRGEVIPTLPFVTSFVSATPERDGGDHTNFVVRLNLRTISAPQRFIISSDSSHHSGANVAEAKVDSLVRSSVPVMTVVTIVTATTDPALVVKEKPIKPSMFSADSSSAGGADPNTGVFLDLIGNDFLVGGIRTVIDPDTDLQKTYVPQWSVTNGLRLDDGRICRKMVDEFAPPRFFASVRGMEHDQLFTEFNVGDARQMSLSVEVMMRAKYNVKESRRLKSVIEKKDELLNSREIEIERSYVKVTKLEASAASKGRELTDLNAQLTFVKSQNDNLVDRIHELEVSSFGLQEKITMYEDCIGQLEKFQDDRMKEVNDKFDKLYADFIEMALHLEERFYPHLFTTISGPAIGKAIEKGMHDGLSAVITHGMEGRALTDNAAYNPSAEADYISALQ